ncbi:MAG: RNA-binding cell elongation regulator Jag/EloR [Tissierellia bacterium]|nr:RNA-binding cell elongation regulator Jag/EloR [Tissierellia bacterium]
MKTVKMAKTVDEAIELGLEELGLSRDQVDVRVLEEPRSGLFGIIGNKDAVVEITQIETEMDPDKDIISEIDEQLNAVREREEKQEQKVNEISVEEPVVEDEETTTEEEDLDTKKAEREEEKINRDEIRQAANNFLVQMLYEMGVPSSVNYSFDQNFLRFEIIPENRKNIGIIIGKRGETLDAIQYLVNLVTNRHSDTYIRVVLDINNYRKKRENSLKRLGKNMAKKVTQYQKTMKLEPMNPYERRIIHTAMQNEEKVKTYSEGKDPYRRVVIEYVEDQE